MSLWEGRKGRARCEVVFISEIKVSQKLHNQSVYNVELHLIKNRRFINHKRASTDFFKQCLDMPIPINLNRYINDTKD